MPTRPGPQTEIAASGCLQHQARAILDRTAILVGAPIRAILQKLVEHIAIATVQLDPVEPSGLGVLGGVAIGLD